MNPQNGEPGTRLLKVSALISAGFNDGALSAAARTFAATTVVKLFAGAFVRDGRHAAPSTPRISNGDFSKWPLMSGFDAK